MIHEERGEGRVKGELKKCKAATNKSGRSQNNAMNQALDSIQSIKQSANSWWKI